MITYDDTVLFVIIRVLRGRNKYVEQKISPMQCIDFRKIAYLRSVIARPATYDLHKEAFFGSVPRNRNLENFTAGRWRKSIAPRSC